MNPARILVAVGGSTVFLRLVGRADFNGSADFRRVVEELSARGYGEFEIDLAECPSMDSTFLGLLAFLATRPSVASGGGAPAKIVLVRPGAAILGSLEELGIRDLFATADSPGVGVEYRVEESAPASLEDRTRASLEGHQALMDLHPSNVPRFKDVVAFLKEDLARLRPPAG